MKAALPASPPANPLPQRYDPGPSPSPNCCRASTPPPRSPPSPTGCAASPRPHCFCSQGIRVGPIDLPTPSSGERRKLLRNALRLTLWRATGSTGAWLAPRLLPANGRIVGCRALGSAAGYPQFHGYLLVCLYYPVFRVWASYGDFGI